MLNHQNAYSVVADYLVPLDSKGRAWVVAEMSDSYPTAISDPFVRVASEAERRVLRIPEIDMVAPETRELAR